MSRAVAAAVAAGLAASLATAAVDELRIARLRHERARLVARADALGRELGRRPQLELERGRLVHRLGRVAAGRTGSASVVALLLAHAARVGASHRAHIVAIAGMPPATGGETAVLELTLEGRYRDVLAAIAALSAGAAPAAVDVTSLVRKNAVSHDATISATVRLTPATDAARPS